MKGFQFIGREFLSQNTEHFYNVLVFKYSDFFQVSLLSGLFFNEFIYSAKNTGLYYVPITVLIFRDTK